MYKKILLLPILITGFSLICIFAKNTLILSVKSDYPISDCIIHFYVNGELINENDNNFSVSGRYDMKLIGKKFWFNKYTFQITSKSKKIDYQDEIFLYRDRVIELYFLNDSISNDYTINKLNKISFEF